MLRKQRTLANRRKSRNRHVSKTWTQSNNESGQSVVAVEAEVEEDGEDLSFAAFESQDLLLEDGAHHIVALLLAVTLIPTFHVAVVGEGLTVGPDRAPDPFLALQRAHRHLAEGMMQAHPGHARLHGLDPQPGGERMLQERREEDQILAVNHANDLLIVQTHHAHGHLEDDVCAQRAPFLRVAAGVYNADIEEDDLTQTPCRGPGRDHATGGVAMGGKMTVGEDLHHIHLMTEETTGLILSGVDLIAMTAA
jgi:hypothetical protein